MTDEITGAPRIELAYDLNAPPQKVWRAISLPAFRSVWLPDADLAEAQATMIKPGCEVRYRMRDTAPPFLESTVTFRIAPNGQGGTRLLILQELDQVARNAANNNSPVLMLAA